MPGLATHAELFCKNLVCIFLFILVALAPLTSSTEVRSESGSSEFCSAGNGEGDCSINSGRVLSLELLDERDLAETTPGDTGTGASSTTSDKWSVYRKLVSEALEAYRPCSTDKESNVRVCYRRALKKDLEPFADGISRDAFLSVLDHGTVYQIINNRLYRQRDCLFPSRCSGIEHFLLKLLKDLPDTEMVVNVRDYPQAYANHAAAAPVFSFSKSSVFDDILYPAWTFWEGGPAIMLYPQGLGRWDLMRDRLLQSADAHPWEKKTPVGFFRGSRTSADRDPLVLLSRQQPGLVDAAYTKNQAWRSEDDTLGLPPADEVSLEDHCQYKYLFNFRGVAASFRLKHLFLCDAVVLNVESDWVEFFYDELKPWVHYIPVRKDLSDVQIILDLLRANDDLARQIASRGKEFVFRHLSLTNVEDYWKDLLTEYSKLLRYAVVKRPDVYEIKNTAS